MDTAKNQNLRNRVLIVIGVIVLVAVGIILQLGWQVFDSLGFGGGTIEITVPTAETLVFLDTNEKAFTTQDNQRVVLEKISSGPHLIIISKENFWPWAKTVEIERNQIIKLHPFYIPQRLDAETILPADPRWIEASNSATKAEAPSEDAKSSSQDSNTTLWVENNKIFVGWTGSQNSTPHYFCKADLCGERIEVFTGLSNIINAEFMNGRNDVVIFSNADGIFAIEIDKNETQNFQPIMRTGSPKFSKTKDGLFVQAGGEIRFIALQ
jgi:hypothetical protein